MTLNSLPLPPAVRLKALLLGLLAFLLAPPAPAQDAEAPALPAALLDPAIPEDELALRLAPLTRDELAALAERWRDIVRAKTEELTEGQIALGGLEGDAASAARDRLAAIGAERSGLFDRYSAVVDAWEAKGGDEAAIKEYRAWREAIVAEATRSADIRTLTRRALAWAASRDGGVRLAIDVGVVLAAFVGLLFAAGIVRRFARRWIGRVPNLSRLLQAFLVAIVYWIVLAFGLMVVLSALGVDVTPVFALVGGASFILAFAFQDTLGNLASGLMIMVNRPFDEGDYVDIGGVGGTVKAVSIVATTVVTPDNQVIVIPNKNVWGNVITNVTISPTRRVDLVFGISYEDSMAEALRLIEETVRAHPLVLAEPEPLIRVNELADSSVNIVCRPWVRGADYWTVYWDLTRQMKERFDEAGISIPYPQTELHVKGPAPAPIADAVSAPSRPSRLAGAAAEAQGEEGEK